MDAGYRQVVGLSEWQSLIEGKIGPAKGPRG